MYFSNHLKASVALFSTGTQYNSNVSKCKHTNITTTLPPHHFHAPTVMHHISYTTT